MGHKTLGNHELKLAIQSLFFNTFLFGTSLQWPNQMLKETSNVGLKLNGFSIQLFISQYTSKSLMGYADETIENALKKVMLMAIFMTFTCQLAL